MTLGWVILFGWLDSVWINKSWRAKSIKAIFGLPSLNWEEQIVVVTGGANGVGRVLVETLLMRGVEVVVIDLVAFGEGLDF